ncbi:MAG TPA: AI-2E family transporter, partial [Rhizobiaceae bacterium]|nr:AI-2E family transporter [Rhizobiaceae bacterium]
METGIENRFRNLVYGVALAIMIGWILYVGSAIFIPVIAAIIVAYIIVTIARRMADIPLVGPYLPVWLRYTSSILAIIGALASVVLLVITNIGQVITLAPHYQAKLLGLIQGIAVRFGVETQPTWATLRRDVLGEISFQNILGSTVTSVSAIAGTLFVV